MTATFDRSSAATEPRHTVASVGIARREHPPAACRHIGNRPATGCSTLRPHLGRITAQAPLAMSARLGDLAARACWTHACYLLDYTYLTRARIGSARSLRYRSGFARLCAPESQASCLPRLGRIP